MFQACRKLSGGDAMSDRGNARRVRWGRVDEQRNDKDAAEDHRS